ncbi:uncharacterized protein LOC141631362 [Silene latifolia]|uniref:uncharacterized protein LOC141631362 n=1 Tax=Silene latifolia TaxID=37657 RepID=UPI003D785D4A
MVERRSHGWCGRNFVYQNAGGLGFRDYVKFNSAMLGKQAWRLLTDEGCLMTRLLKSKYFPSSSFLEAMVGSNPSYSWRSIYEAKSVLYLGLRQRVGDGLSSMWCGERDGIYSVRSAYRLLVKQDGDLEGSPSNLNGSWLCHKIWRALVLPRINVFFWKLCNAAIDIRGNLSSRMRSAENECLRCGDCVESCLHVVSERRWVGGVWGALDFDLPSCSGFARVRDWVEVALREMGLQEQVEYMTGCWAIWERRNKAIFEDGEWRADLVVIRVRDLVCEMAEFGSFSERRTRG